MNLPDLDKVIHERARFRILACLMARRDRKCSFTDLRDMLELTGGNLSSQLSVLEEKKLVHIEKRFEGKKPLTEISLTIEGERAFSEYLETLDQLIRTLKSESADASANAGNLSRGSQRRHE